MLPTLLITIALSAGPALAGPQVDVQTLAGPSVSGALIELNAEQAVVDAPRGRVRLPLEQLVSLAPVQVDVPPPGLSAEAWVDLTDGSALVVHDYRMTDGRAKITLVDGSAFDVPAPGVARVQFAPRTPALDAEWARISQMKFTADVLVVRKGDTLDYHQGTLHDVGPIEAQFDLEGDRLPVKRSKIGGLMYYHPAGQKLPGAVARATDGSGSRWAVARLASSGRLVLTTPTGLEIPRAWSAVRRIDFSSDKVLYLSDLPAQTMSWKPFFRPDSEVAVVDQYFAPRPDRALDRDPLQLGGKAYRKGLAMHSRTEMVFRLPDRFQRFKALAGIDDHLRPYGAVRLVIRGDDRELLSARLTGRDTPVSIDLDISGVRRLTILADFAGVLDVGSHLLLCEARVVK